MVLWKTLLSLILVSGSLNGALVDKLMDTDRIYFINVPKSIVTEIGDLTQLVQGHRLQFHSNVNDTNDQYDGEMIQILHAPEEACPKLIDTPLRNYNLMFHPLYVVSCSSNWIPVLDIANCVSHNHKGPWFHLYYDESDQLFQVSTYSGRTVEVDYIQLHNYSLLADLGGHEVRVTYPPNGRLTFINPDPSKASFTMDLMKMIANNLNFSMVFIPPESGTFGIEDDQGNFNGMIGDLQNDIADIAVGDISHSVARSRVATPSVELWKELSNIYYSKQNVIRNVYWTAFLDVFDFSLWFTTCVIGFCSFVCFFFTTLVITVSKSSSTKIKVIVSNAVAITLKALVMQGHPTLESHLTSVRLIVFSICVCGSIIFWTYNGCLVSYLAVDIDQHPFTSFDNMANMPSNYKMIVVKDGYAEALLRRAIHRRHPGVLAIKDRIYRADTYLQSRIMVKSGEGAGLMSNIMQDDCQLIWNGMTLSETGVGWFYNKYFIAKAEVNFELLKIRERGLLNRLWRTYLFNPALCLNTKAELPSPISGLFVASLFAILLSGIIISILVLVLEKFIKIFFSFLSRNSRV